MPPQRSEADEQALVARLRARDEAAFTELVIQYSPMMLRVARTYVPSREVAEEVVQEAWVAALRGIDGFAERSTFRTWLFRILVNQAKRRGERERRSLPFSVAFPEERDEDGGPSVPVDRFRTAADRWPGHWLVPPQRWTQPEDRVVAAELGRVVGAAVDDLPERQRTVLTLRDVHGWSADEVCSALAVSPSNQRVLLHRARTAVRQRVDAVLGPAALQGPGA